MLTRIRLPGKIPHHIPSYPTHFCLARNCWEKVSDERHLHEVGLSSDSNVIWVFLLSFLAMLVLANGEETASARFRSWETWMIILLHTWSFHLVSPSCFRAMMPVIGANFHMATRPLSVPPTNTPTAVDKDYVQENGRESVDSWIEGTNRRRVHCIYESTL